MVVEDEEDVKMVHQLCQIQDEFQVRVEHEQTTSRIEREKGEKVLYQPAVIGKIESLWH